MFACACACADRETRGARWKREKEGWGKMGCYQIARKPLSDLSRHINFFWNCQLLEFPPPLIGG